MKKILVDANGRWITDENSSMIVIEQLDSPVLSVSGNIVSWDSVQNATYYNLYIDGILIDTDFTSTTIDVSSLSVWSTFDGGIHLISCVACSVGYVSSAQSNSVEVSKFNSLWLSFYANASTNIAFTVHGTIDSSTSLYYMIGSSGTPTKYTFGTTITLSSYQRCYFWGNNASFSIGNSNYIQFSSTGSVSASGNVNSLYDSTCTSTELPCNYCFSRLFMSCSTLTSAPSLPATIITDYCYMCMFYDCTSLTTATALPATTLMPHCYHSMFFNTAITSTPTLSATNLANSCYYWMFAYCTKLTSITSLPATVLYEYCYAQMFAQCTSLNTVPKLPANELAYCCYSCMFQQCKNLTISDSSGSYSWRIPTSGTFTNTTTYDQNYMFTNCAGTRSSNNMTGVCGSYHIYYVSRSPK